MQEVAKISTAEVTNLAEKQKQALSEFESGKKAISDYLAANPCKDEAVCNLAYEIARYTYNGLSRLIKEGKTLPGMAEIINSRYAEVTDKLLKEQENLNDIERFVRICDLLKDTIVLSINNGDLSCVYSECYVLGVKLLGEGVARTPDQHDNVVMFYSQSEQERMCEGIRRIIDSWEMLFNMLGMKCEGFSYFNLPQYYQQIKGMTKEERVRRILFRGSPEQAMFNQDYFSQRIVMLNVNRRMFDSLSSPEIKQELEYLPAETILGVENQYNVNLLLLRHMKSMFVNPLKSERDMGHAINRVGVACAIKNGEVQSWWAKLCANEKACEDLLKSASGRTPEEIAQTEAKLQALRRQKQIGLQKLNEGGFTPEEAGIRMNKPKALDDKLLESGQSADAQEGVEARCENKAEVKGRGDMAFITDALRGKTLYGVKRGYLIAILNDGQTVCWKMGGGRKECRLSAEAAVRLFERLFQANLNGATESEKRPVYVTAPLWNYVREKVGNKASNDTGVVREFFSTILVRDDKKGKTRYEKVPSNQIERCGTEKKMSFVYRVYLNPLLTANGETVPRK